MQLIQRIELKEDLHVMELGVEIKELAKNNNFTFYNLYGKKRNYTFNFKK